MGRMQVRPGQVSGLYNETLAMDVVDIVEKAKTFDRPVNLPTDLPTEGNDDGDVRLVLSENRFYVWDAPTQDWFPDIDQMTEARTVRIPIYENRQVNFSTDLQVGIPNGIANLDTIVLLVNGMAQHRDTDYILGVSGQNPPTLIVTWQSSDFELEIDDVMQVNYDKLIVT